MIIVDPAIATGEQPGTYPPYEDGNEQGVWVLNSTGQPLYGEVWPESPVNYPDFTHPATGPWWQNCLEDFRNIIEYDGIWIDMNEPSNFVQGSIDGCPVNKLTFPPYVPKILHQTLSTRTICMDSNHHDGTHYDTHSMYGYWEAVVTKAAMEQTLNGQRGFLLSRSTFIGSGRYAAHWLGDNWSQWSNLKTSIIGMLEFNQFGIPMVGADICGFTGNPSEEMCSRWQQLGAFYPFSRNHNQLLSDDQDPGVWPGVAIRTREALLV